MAQKKAKAQPGKRHGPSGNVFAGATDKSQHSTCNRHVQQPGEVAIYDGRRFAGSILQQRGRYVAFDEHGHRIGSFDRERGASSAVFAAAGGGS